MLAVAGFLVAGLCFGYFAYTFQSLVVTRTGLKLDAFAYAFYSLAAAFLIWGVAVIIATPAALAVSVVIGEAIILLGTLFLIRLLVDSRPLLWALVVLAAALLYTRVTYFYPEPYLLDGVVIFNIPTVVGVVLGLAIIGVWLPASWRVARQVAVAIHEPSLSRTYGAIYVAAALAAVLFTAVRRPITAVATFVALIICFGLLIGSNVVVKMVKEPHGRTHKA